MARYKVVKFWADNRTFPDWKVIDTERGDNCICECFTEGDAMMIVDALNKGEL